MALVGVKFSHPALTEATILDDFACMSVLHYPVYLSSLRQEDWLGGFCLRCHELVWETDENVRPGEVEPAWREAIKAHVSTIETFGDPTIRAVRDGRLIYLTETDQVQQSKQDGHVS